MLFRSLFITLFLIGFEATEQQEVKSTLLNTVESSIVKQIKSLTTPEGILLGDLIEAGMGSCTYELYDPAEDGNTYVTISGNITYDGIPVVAKLQYKQISESEFEFYTLVYNDYHVHNWRPLLSSIICMSRIMRSKALNHPQKR